MQKTGKNSFIPRKTAAAAAMRSTYLTVARRIRIPYSQRIPLIRISMTAPPSRLGNGSKLYRQRVRFSIIKRRLPPRSFVMTANIRLTAGPDSSRKRLRFMGTAAFFSVVIIIPVPLRTIFSAAVPAIAAASICPSSCRRHPL